jgi:hypothetical protein
MAKSPNRIIKKLRILGKIIRNRFDQPKSLTFAYVPIYLRAIPTTTPSLFLSIADYK